MAGVIIHAANYWPGVMIGGINPDVVALEAVLSSDAGLVIGQGDGGKLIVFFYLLITLFSWVVLLL